MASRCDKAIECKRLKRTVNTKKDLNTPLINLGAHQTSSETRPDRHVVARSIDFLKRQLPRKIGCGIRDGKSKVFSGRVQLIVVRRLSQALPSGGKLCRKIVTPTGPIYWDEPTTGVSLSAL
jgi:hypothetical protein